ncbi:MAG: class E sortase [Acidimicrobiia bacterium]|nr:class E sortase [Acidimicrobiia bacterium]
MPGARSDPTLSRTRRVALGAIALAAAVALVAVLILTSTSTPARRVAHGLLPRTASAHTPTVRTDPPKPDRPSTTTTPTAPPASPPSPPPAGLLQPADVPAPDVILPIQLIGRIQIPKIGLDTDLRDQITQQSIDLGPSHWPGTAPPGGFGNAVIAGHRNSHSAPFHDVGNLVPGDAITLVAADGRPFHYVVTELFVVTPDAVWITEQTPGHTLTLFTCHPLGSSAQRLVVRATLV